MHRREVRLTSEIFDSFVQSSRRCGAKVTSQTIYLAKHALFEPTWFHIEILFFQISYFIQ